MLNPRSLFFSKLVLVSLMFHILVLLFFFVAYQSNKTIALTMSHIADVDFSTISLVPLAKNIPGAQAKVVANAIRTKATSVNNKEKNANTKTAKPTANSTTLGSAKPESKKVQPTTKSSKKSVAQKEQPKKKDIKKEQKIAKKEQPKAKEPVKETKPEQLKESPATDQSQENVEQTTIPIDQPQETVYVGRNDLEALYMQGELYQALAQHWRPPVGMQEDISCCLKVIIAKDGKVHDVQIEQSSDVVVYDIAARNAIINTQFPKSVWGKEITITFNR